MKVEQTGLHLFTTQQANKMASQTDREENLKCPQIPPISAPLTILLLHHKHQLEIIWQNFTH